MTLIYGTGLVKCLVKAIDTETAGRTAFNTWVQPRMAPPPAPVTPPAQYSFSEAIARAAISAVQR